VKNTEKLGSSLKIIARSSLWSFIFIFIFHWIHYRSFSFLKNIFDTQLNFKVFMLREEKKKIARSQWKRKRKLINTDSIHIKNQYWCQQVHLMKGVPLKRSLAFTFYERVDLDPGRFLNSS